VASEPTPPAPGSSVVAVEGSDYRYTLRVDGQPAIVQGMGYNPWYAELPSDERRQYYRRDFGAMREIGVNTLEGWFQPQFDEVTLDEAHRQGLKVIMPFELNHDYDYSDPAVKAMFREQVTAWVLRYREHPAVLMWGPGNEVMHRLIFPTAVQGQRDPAREQRADDFAAFYVELIDMIRQLDPHHPVVYRDAEDLYFSRLRQALVKDGTRRPWFIYGTNVYTERLAEVIERWPTQGLDAPLLVSEFSPGGVGAAERPNMLGWYWSTIRAHPKRVLGGVVYTWATRGPEDLDRVFGLTDESGAPVDGSLAALGRLFKEDVLGTRAPHRER
jgi:beta-galactosidase/beta-glucuronidase